MNRITIIAGHFGSGKTEFAVNYAFKLKEEFEKVTIVDLDTVNPYFRTKDAKEALEEKGINVIVPEFANSNLDIITIPSEVLSVFADDSCHAILDVGGDDEGAMVLGMFNRYLNECGYEMYLVLNHKRPFTKDAQESLEMISAIEATSRLKFSGIVSNSNLMEHTTAEIVSEGEALCEDISEKSGIPLKFVSSTEENSELIKNKDKLFILDFYIKKPF